MTPSTLALALDSIFTGLVGAVSMFAIASKTLGQEEVNGAYLVGGAAAFLFALSIMALVS